jgi:hypothetical protein
METMVLASLLSGLSVIALAQAVLLWRASRSLRRIDGIDARVEKFAEALTLLTDTTESAFRSVASEIARTPRPSAVDAGAISSALTARVMRATRSARSVSEIAAAEEIAETEVRLRLQVAKDETPATTPAEMFANWSEAYRGALRLE